MPAALAPAMSVRCRVADVHGFGRIDRKLLKDACEDPPVGLAPGALVGEVGEGEEIEQVVAAQKLAQDPARRKAGVDDEGELVVRGELRQHLAHAGQELGVHLEDELLEEGRKAGQRLARLAYRQGRQDDFECLGGPGGAVLIDPDPVEPLVGAL